jgi:excisionase family DNA binding protein
MQTDNKLAFSPNAAAEATGVGRTKIFEAIKEHQLKARKFGRRTIILRDDLLAWLLALPLK